MNPGPPIAARNDDGLYAANYRHMDANAILAKIDRLSEIPTLPTILLEVSRLLQNPDATSQQLARLIKKDQSITAKILRLVNSAFYGCQSRISDVNSAVMVMGFNTVRNAIMSISVIKAFADIKDMEQFKVEDFWFHALSVAITSRHMALQCHKKVADESFVAGLLHDIGKVILSQWFRDLFVDIWKLARETGIPFIQAENALSPLNHAQIGSHLAKKWKLPSDFAETIRWHHSPHAVKEVRAVSTIVAVADAIVNRDRVAIDVATKGMFEGANNDLTFALAEHTKTVDEWHPRLEDSIEEAVEVFFG
jgi:putative nucleotidyltransferase with HDIG domain